MKWRINFSIINSNYNLISYATSEFLANIPKKKNGKQLFREWYLEHENGATTAYIPVTVIEAVVDWIKNKIIAEPEWADSLHETAEKLNWDYFNYAKSLTDLDLKNLSNNELILIYKKLKDLQKQSHVLAISTTWFLDSDGEVYSEFLRQELKKHLQSVNVNDPVKIIEYFVILTTPTKENFANQEEIEFLELLKKVENSKLGADDSVVVEYYKKWRWTPYGYIGPAYTLDYYKRKIEQTLMGAKDFDKIIIEEKSRNAKMSKQQDQLIKDIQLPDKLWHLFRIAQDIIWLKDFRKYCIWHGHYILDILTKEIALRLHISHRQANYFLVEEIEGALNTGVFDENLLNDRIKYSVIWANENECKIFYGEEARQKIQNLDVEQVQIDLAGGFRGSCAFPGVVKGKVKIVNSVEEIDKVESGDIMLALTTYPALLPAMKKASAIVTEDGGITCHAAIVARELKIPCVVGAKKITLFLKDGDEVEVDATNGVIRKI